MATQASTTSNRDAASMAGYWTPGPNGTKPGDYYVTNPSDDENDTGGEQSASGDGTSNGGATANPPPPAGPATADGGGATDDGNGALPGIGAIPGIGDIADLGNGSGDGSSFDLAGAGAPLQPIFDTTNGVVEGVTGFGLLDDAVNVANTAGVSTIGAAPSADGHSNLITDTLNLPGSILSGDLNGGLANITADLNDTLNATTGLLNNVLGAGGLPTDQILGGGAGSLIDDVVALPGNALDGGIPHVIGDLTDTAGGIAGGADGLGSNGLLQPVINLVDSAGGDLQTNSVLGLSSDGSTGGILGGTVGDLGGSSSGNAATVEVGSESDDGTGIGILSSAGSGHAADISALDVGTDGPQIANLSVLSDANGLNLPALDGLGIPDLAGTDLAGADSGDLLTVNGGNNADNGGVIGGGVANLDGSSSGQLIAADAGPQDNGLGLGVLAVQPDGDNTANVSVVDVGPHGPQLADLGVLTDATDIISIPSLNGAGLDGLTGDLLGTTALGGDTGAATSLPVVADLGDTLDLLPGSITGDHGILDVNGNHII